MRAHIIDQNIQRRGLLSRAIFERGVHPELFDSAKEFLAYGPQKGYVLYYDPRSQGQYSPNDELLRDISRDYCTVMYSDKLDVEVIVRAMLEGAIDYLQWPVEPERIDRLILEMEEREEFHRKEIAIQGKAQSLVERLTDREREVLTLITRGLSNKLIARELQISPRTVEIHRANAFDKINASSTADAVRIGVHARLDREE